MTELNIGFAGEYTLTRRNADTGEVVESHGPFKNLITNIGLDRLAIGDVQNYCYVGSGSTPPVNGNTAMQVRVATNNSQIAGSSTTQTTAPYVVTKSVTYRFDRGAAAGNLTEVGVGWTFDSVGGIFSRALIVDSSGNPVTITVLANEILDVTYVLKHYPVLTDTPATLVLAGVTYNLVMRPAAIAGRQSENYGLIPNSLAAYANFVMGPITEDPGGDRIHFDTRTVNIPYVTGTYYQDGTFILPEGSANHPNGISGFSLRTPGRFSDATALLYVQMSVSPPIPKDNTKTLSLTFRVSWGRYTP